MNFFTKLTIGTALALTAMIPSSAANAGPILCDTYGDTDVCVTAVDKGVDRVSFEDTDGNWGAFDVTCTGTHWVLHGGHGGNVTQSTMEYAAQSYCEGRGSNL